MNLLERIGKAEIIREEPSLSLGMKRLVELENNPNALAWIWTIDVDGKQCVPKDGEMFSSQEEALKDLVKFVIFLAKNLPDD